MPIKETSGEITMQNNSQSNSDRQHFISNQRSLGKYKMSDQSTGLETKKISVTFQKLTKTDSRAYLSNNIS